MSELQVVIVDDDEWKRAGMRQRLDVMHEIGVVEAVDHDTAAAWPLERWKDVEAVLVDVFDDRAPGEVGTDLYSGIKVVERIRGLPVRCVAVTPSCPHPLVQLRLAQAEPDYCYHRFQVVEPGALAEALRFPDRAQRLTVPDAGTIRAFGGRKLLANDAVRAYEESGLYGTLHSGSGLKELKSSGVSRRDVDRLKGQIERLGFNHLEVEMPGGRTEHAYDDKVRWPVVRTLLLRLLGRLDAPWSEFDKPWWL